MTHQVNYSTSNGVRTKAPGSGNGMLPVGIDQTAAIRLGKGIWADGPKQNHSPPSAQPVNQATGTLQNRRCT
jgi:hypothetical protein